MAGPHQQGASRGALTKGGCLREGEGLRQCKGAGCDRLMPAHKQRTVEVWLDAWVVVWNSHVTDDAAVSV